MEGFKNCGRCGQLLPLASFNFRDKARNKPQSHCRNCSNCSNAAWQLWSSNPSNKQRHLETLRARRGRRIARNKALVAKLKSEPCADCGRRFPIEAMDFDHLEGKEALISKLVYTVGEQRLRREIAKCEVVCSNCHRVRSMQRLNRR